MKRDARFAGCARDRRRDGRRAADHGRASAGAVLSCGFSSTNAVAAPIPDNGTATSTSNLSGLTVNDPLVDLDVTINITHPFVEDLVVSLSYAGNTVLLVSRRGFGGDNFTNTRFNDGADNHISTGSAPFKEFRGILRCTSAPRCAERKPVRIYKVQAGDDALISRTFTTTTGNYVVPRASVGGTYYAVAPKVVEERVAECKRAQSGNLAL